MRIRCLLFTLVLLLATAPVHASLGVLPQCVASSQDVSTATADSKSPLPELPRVVSSYGPEDRDYLIRTIAFEAGEEPDEGKAAVAHVVLNRERSGRWGESIKKVVTRAWQFEPWMTKRKQMVSLSPNDPRYRDAARIADAVLSGQIPDPTAGATHFLNPHHCPETARRLCAGLGTRGGAADRPTYFLRAERRGSHGGAKLNAHGCGCFGHIPVMLRPRSRAGSGCRIDDARGPGLTANVR